MPSDATSRDAAVNGSAVQSHSIRLPHFLLQSISTEMISATPQLPPFSSHSENPRKAKGTQNANARTYLSPAVLRLEKGEH